MRLDQALQKIGVEVVKADTEAGKLTILMRVHRSRDGLHQKRWAYAASKLVKVANKSSAAGQWGADVSKVLVESHGAVVYFWRVIFFGNLKTGQRVFGEAVLEALRQGVEIKSMPLVGQVRYEHDPATGKLKGGHNLGTGESIVGAHFTVR